MIDSVHFLPGAMLPYSTPFSTSGSAIKIFAFLCHTVTQGIDFRQSPFQYTSLSSTVKFKENGSTLRKLVLTVPKEHPVYTLETCIAWVLIAFIDIKVGNPKIECPTHCLILSNGHLPSYIDCVTRIVLS